MLMFGTNTQHRTSIHTSAGVAFTLLFKACWQLSARNSGDVTLCASKAENKVTVFLEENKNRVAQTE